MTAPAQPMPAVQETGDRMVFHVRSARNPAKAYRVDLTANGGAGECSCPDWGIRRRPALRDGVEPWSPQATCRHVRLAGRHFLKGLLQAMAKSESTPANK